MPRSLALIGFEPFAGRSLNASAEVIRLFEHTVIPGLVLHRLVLPVDRMAGPPHLINTLKTLQPDWCVILGEAKGRAAFSIERVAVNLSDFGIPDNGGHQPRDEEVVNAGPAAYFVSLPVRTLVSAIQTTGLPVKLSLSAGSFLCNYMLYLVLHICASEGLATNCGLIHLPVFPAQVTPDQKNVPTLELDQLYQGVRAICEALAQVSLSQPSPNRVAS
ncbi:MAG: pyroglutamyl-peptidase I [Chloroflexales bacterium]|nr:pyroglutamyl-peptidase I [Chloroflexales bacterium]